MRRSREGPLLAREGPAPEDVRPGASGERPEQHDDGSEGENPASHSLTPGGFRQNHPEPASTPQLVGAYNVKVARTSNLREA